MTKQQTFNSGFWWSIYCGHWWQGHWLFQ